MKTQWMKTCARVAWMAFAGATSGCHPGDNGPRTTASSLEGKCTIEVVNGLVQRCCRRLGPYDSFTNCMVYSNDFHRTCDAEGIACRTIVAMCDGASIGHAFNMVRLSDGRWCFVQSTAGTDGTPGYVVEPCFTDPNPPRPKRSAGSWAGDSTPMAPARAGCNGRLQPRAPTTATPSRLARCRPSSAGVRGTSPTP